MARITELPQLSSDEDELPPVHIPIQSTVKRAAIQLPVAKRAVVELPAVETSEEEIEDFTTGRDIVRKIVEETGQDDDSQVTYKVEFEDYHVEEITFDQLLELDNGRTALEDFTNAPSEDESSEPELKMVSTTRTRPRKTQREGFVNTAEAIEGSGEEAYEDKTRSKRHRRQQRSPSMEEPDSEESDSRPARRSKRISSMDAEDTGCRRGTRGRETRQSARNLRTRSDDIDESNADDQDSEADVPFLASDLLGSRKRKRTLRTGGERLPSYDEDGIGYNRSSKKRREATRQSGRATRHQGGMQEVEVNDIYRSDSDDGARAPAKPKATGAREAFKALPRNDDFRVRHIQTCETCGNGPNFAPLIYCQGCTLAYHKQCLGHRTNREHLATKVGDGDFVLQCRRCVAFPRKKDHTAPDQGKCQDCHEHGLGCTPFRPRKTPAQEQKDRDDKEGGDPSYDVDRELISNADNVMFRCTKCWRAFHFEHLPSRSDVMELDTDADAEQRFREYSRDWECKECAEMPAKVSGIIAWKPIDEDTYDTALDYDMIDEDEKAYLIKWEGQSYHQAAWMPGPWVWGVTAGSMRKAFSKREQARFPKMRTEDAIPEDYLRVDIVLDIKFTSIVDIRTEEVDKARIREVDKAFVKYKGLGYEDAVWEEPPSVDDGDRWTDFVTAYNDWVLGRYVRQPVAKALKTRLEKARDREFAKLEKKAQPDNLVGGELMKYQVEGLNWLYYKWHTKKNAILADEMGLGKTIQIIGFLATLVQDWNCFPFLVVVPNSTCANWRREIKRWAPSLRVVAYFGSKESRDLAYRHELYPEGSKDLRCHVVVTSYDAAADDSCRRFFRAVPWQALIVDEGQRLKNEKTLLSAALSALKAPFKVLLTGTPLQNNARELFNLLHFLDESYDAAVLEEEYADLDATKIAKLHDMIRPFFLRRTKAQVLTFLPLMAQLIVPVSMSVLQKTVYRNILAKDPELMKAIFSQTTLKQGERASLSNILMQLRKCLCHPFVYSRSIEDRNVSIAASHQNLVQASAKLQLLEVMLPKLKERGHRVLIFSQFLEMLDMVEDFLDGLELEYRRLDGTIGSLQKQKRIDEFNAPDSPLFAFLLSTRAGGVGINLATADTVIILDPDFNPHQDIQALSRAHRIGQHKKVRCFQLITRASVEQKIAEIGRKKLALDQVLIQNMDANDAADTDITSVLRFGASELFSDNGSQDIVYDSASVDRLLDRSQMEDTKAGEDKSAESQFSFARVWANDQGALEDTTTTAEEQAPDPGVWANILKERERIAAAEAAAKAEAFGRGRRARATVDYVTDKAAAEAGDGLDTTPTKPLRKAKSDEEDDTDFQAEQSDVDSAPEETHSPVDQKELDAARQKTGSKILAQNAPTFRRVVVPPPRQIQNGLPTLPDTNVPQYSYNPNPSSLASTSPSMVNCIACQTIHLVGSCPLKVAGVEFCNLCGLAHYGHARVCLHIQSETQVRAMLESLKQSNEPHHLVKEASRYLRGVKGSLVQQKKLKAANAALANGSAVGAGRVQATETS